MSMTANEIINDARDFHVTFSPTKVPTGSLLRALSRGESAFYRDVSKIDHNALEAAVIIEEIDARYALADGEAIEIPAFLTINTITAIFNDGSTENVRILDPRNDGVCGEVYARPVGTTLYLAVVGGEEADGADGRYDRARARLACVRSLRILYTPSPVAFTATAQLATAPDTARSYLVAFLVAFMAGRVSSPESGALMGGAAATMQSVVDVFLNPSNTAWHVTDGRG